MLQNYSKLPKFIKALALPVWVVVSFYMTQIIVVVALRLLIAVGVPVMSLNSSVLNATAAAAIYLITLIIVIGLPWLIKKRSTSLKDIGLTRLPTWTDILMAPAGLIIYIFLSAILIYITTQILPGFDINQAQDTGFSGINQRYELILAFITLVVVAPIAEEVLFRGYLYGKIKKYLPIWVAILLTSVTFGFLHGAWNLGVDTFALSVILCLLRESTGNIWSSILLHMAKNGIAFYFLFIVSLH
ncbi:MAG: type II CAAX endopeptidase family protein [Candidatus Saccharibacteria bacterium]